MLPVRRQHAEDPDPFNRLLKIVALVDENNRDVRQLLDLLSAERFQVEVSQQLPTRSFRGCRRRRLHLRHRRASA